MDNEQLWKEYRALQGTTDTAHTIEVLHIPEVERQGRVPAV